MVIRQRILSKEEQQWFNCETVLFIEPWGWFPVKALCDVAGKFKRYQPKPGIEGFRIGGNLGSGSVGISESSVPLACKLLIDAGSQLEDSLTSHLAVL